MDRAITLVWDPPTVNAHLGDAHLLQGWLFGTLASLPSEALESIAEQTMTDEIVASAAIEGTGLDAQAVRAQLDSFRRGDFSFITAELHDADPKTMQTAGAADVAFDSTAGCFIDMTPRRLAKWHEVLYAGGQAGSRRAEPGQYRKSRFEDGPSEALMAEVDAYVAWLNDPPSEDLLLKGAIGHLAGFLIRPFATGNGRVIRALSELLLMRADVAAADKVTLLLDDGEGPALLYRFRSMGAASVVIAGLPPRFYSLSPHILDNLTSYKAEIMKVRDAIRDADAEQPFACDITSWILWYLEAVKAAIRAVFERLPETPTPTMDDEPATKYSPTSEHSAAPPPAAAKESAGNPNGVPTRSDVAPMRPIDLSDLPISVRQGEVLSILAADILEQGDGANHISTGRWAELCDVSTDTALRDITDLVKKGVLVKDARRSGRSTFYRIVDEVLADL